MLDKLLRKKWDKFLNGKWQRTMPQQAGRFPVATLDGLVTFNYRVVYFDIEKDRFCSAGSWGGYWWSESIPSLPKPPVEKERPILI
jgi:hypothetical protein